MKREDDVAVERSDDDDCVFVGEFRYTAGPKCSKRLIDNALPIKKVKSFQNSNINGTLKKEENAKNLENVRPKSPIKACLFLQSKLPSGKRTTKANKRLKRAHREIETYMKRKLRSFIRKTEELANAKKVQLHINSNLNQDEFLGLFGLERIGRMPID